MTSHCRGDGLTPVLAFLGFDTLAGALWAGLFLAIGWVFASQIQQVLDLLSTLGSVAAAVLGVLAAAYLVLRYWRRLFRQGLALPRVGELVLYCNCPNEASAARAVHLLAAKGFTRVRALSGGIDGWVASGHGIEFDAPAVPAPATAAPGD